MNCENIKGQECNWRTHFNVKLGMRLFKVSLFIITVSLAMGVFVPLALSAQPWILPIDSQVKQKSTKDPAYLNFVEADLKDIIHAVSEITGENFILAPGINVKITIQTTRSVPRSEIFGVFESILEVNGLAAVKAGSYYKIVRSKSANRLAAEIRQGRKRTDIAPGDRIITQVTSVRYVSTKDLVAILKPMLSSSGNVVEYSKANALIITDTAFSVRKALKIVMMLDVNAFKRMSIALVPIVNVDSSALYKELSEVLKTLGYGNDVRQLNVMLVERLNSLIVSSSDTKLLESVKEWIGRLDKVSSSDIGNQAPLHIYYVKNDKASNIKTILDKVFSDGLVLPLKSKKVKTSLPTLRPKGAAVSGGLVGEKIKIHLYEPFNALIIHASTRDYQYVEEIIKELDRPSKQVLIDTLIVEVKLDETTKYGVQWSVLTGNVNLQQNTGIVSSTIANPKVDITTPVGATAASGLMAFATDAKNFFGVIQALATDGKINVLSNPHIMVKNYEKASINIGSDEPIATQSTQSAVTGTSSLIQNIEYRKTGILLTVTPQITEGGMIVMQIRQEVSDKSTDRIVGNGTFPSFTKREAETSIIAKDGETMVIGGLIQERKDKTTSGVPFFRSIPILGNLFKYTTDTIGKTELIILLTPRIISNPEQAVDISNELKEKLTGLKELLRKGGQGE